MPHFRIYRNKFYPWALTEVAGHFCPHCWDGKFTFLLCYLTVHQLQQHWASHPAGLSPFTDPQSKYRDPVLPAGTRQVRWKTLGRLWKGLQKKKISLLACPPFIYFFFLDGFSLVNMKIRQHKPFFWYDMGDLAIFHYKV